MPWIGHHDALSFIVHLRPVIRQKKSSFIRQSGIVFLQSGDNGFLVRIRSQSFRFLPGIQPAFQSSGCHIRTVLDNTVTFQTDQLRYPRRSDSRVNTGDIPSQAVTDQPDRFIGRIAIQQSFQIRQIIRKPVPSFCPAGMTKTAHIRRNHMPVTFECIHDKLKRSGYIHPAMYHKQLRRTFIAPVTDTQTHVISINKFCS